MRQITDMNLFLKATRVSPSMIIAAMYKTKQKNGRKRREGGGGGGGGGRAKTEGGQQGETRDYD